MKIMKLIPLLAVLLLCGNAFAQIKPVAFEVYPSMAKVTFEAATDNETTLTLPYGFDASTVRIVEKQGASTAKSFKVETGTGNFSIPDYLVAAKKEIGALSKKIDEMGAKYSGLELSALLLDNLNADKVKPEELTAYITKTAALRTKTELEMKSLFKDITESKEKLKILEADYNKRMPADWNKTLNVVVKTEGKGKVYIEATTYKAGWVPKYKLNLDSATGKITASLSAAIRQSTGIKWKGAFTLNTAAPLYGNTSTEIPPAVANIYNPSKPVPVPYATRSAQKSEIAVSAMMMDVNEAMPVYTETAINYSYTVKASVSGDGAAENIPLKNFTINSAVSFEAIPLLDDKAFITSKIASLNETLLSGTAALYIDGEHSQETNLREYVKGSDFSMAFGLSAGISVTKQKFIAKKDSSWRKGIMNDGYDIKVVNGTAKQQKVVVKDRIPVAADSKISVEDVQTTPKTSSISETGICLWELELKPNETVNIKVHYTIKYPSDSELVVGPALR